MISGSVSAGRQATVRLTVFGPGGQVRDVEAIIDTGFTGFLTLPPDVIQALGLIRRGRERAILEDGSMSSLEVFAASLHWDGQTRTVPVFAA